MVSKQLFIAAVSHTKNLKWKRIPNSSNFKYTSVGSRSGSWQPTQELIGVESWMYIYTHPFSQILCLYYGFSIFLGFAQDQFNKLQIWGARSGLFFFILKQTIFNVQTS